MRLRARSLVAPAVATVILAMGVPAYGQARWSVAIVTGHTSTGPAHAIERAMDRAQFDDTPPCILFCGGRQSPPHPNSHTGWGSSGFPWQLELRYRHTARLGAAVVAGKSELGMTSGYREAPDGGFGEFLFVNYRVDHIATLLTATYAAVRAEAGPALYRSASWQDASGERAHERSERHLGFIAGAGASGRVWRRLAIELSAHYRRGGDMTIGPFDTQREPSFTATPAPFSHLFVGIGAGIKW